MHFTALVVAEDHKKALAPYHEFECTGEDDEFIQDIDETPQVLQEFEGFGKSVSEFLKYYGYEAVTDESRVDIGGDHKYGYLLLSPDGSRILKRIRRTNPNAKWDWYVIGGRWSDFFLHKDGHRCDVIRKGELDFESERVKISEERRDTWHRFREIAGEPWDTFDAILNRIAPDVDKPTDDQIKSARIMYSQQPAVRRLHEAKEWDIDAVAVPLDEYVNVGVGGVFSTYAVVRNGQWIDRDRTSRDDWHKWFVEFYSTVDDSELLTLVDCHI